MTIPPHSPASERALVGCLLQDAKQCLPVVLQKMTAQDIYNLPERTVFEAVCALADANKPVDLATVITQLKNSGLLDAVGGIVFLSELQDAAPSVANLEAYLAEVVDKAMLRELSQTCTSICDRVATAKDAEELANEAERAILGVRAKRECGRGVASLDALQNELVSDYEAAATGAKPTGLLTGFADLDWVAGGMQPQELIYIAGTPSAGKTTMLLNILFHNAEHGVPVGIISLETSAKKLVHRLHCMAGQVDGGIFLRGQSDEQSHQKMMAGMMRVKRVREMIHLRDDVFTVAQLTAACRQMYQKGVRLIGVDYLQKINCGHSKEYDNVTAGSAALKAIARDLNIPVVAISSLNRGEKDEKKKPSINDLRGSGNCEFDGDKIYLLHCEDRESNIREVEINVAKNKDGECGRRSLTMFASQFRFESAARIADEDVRKQYRD